MQGNDIETILSLIGQHRVHPFLIELSSSSLVHGLFDHFPSPSVEWEDSLASERCGLILAKLILTQV